MPRGYETRSSSHHERMGRPKQRRKDITDIRETTRAALPIVRFAHLLTPESHQDVDDILALGVDYNHINAYDLPDPHSLTSIGTVRLNAKALGVLGIGEEADMDRIGTSMVECCSALARQMYGESIAGHISKVATIGNDLIASVESELIDKARNTIGELLQWAGVDLNNLQPMGMTLASSRSQGTLIDLRRVAETELVEVPLRFDLLDAYNADGVSLAEAA